MGDGYLGRLIFVDLTLGSIKEVMFQEEMRRRFIGGVGLGVRILYERLKPKVDPLGPNNLLGFVTGPLTGTLVPWSARCTVVTKSPLTGGWGDSSFGGFFGPELKAAGYDAVFFSGVSPRPVYLLLSEDRPELKDATQLWGKDTAETEEILRQELGDQTARIACIGPSGESQSLLAAIICDRGRVAGRSGVGAVMGAKRLKAVAVRGTQKTSVADTNRLNALRKDYLRSVRENKVHGLEGFKQFGTSLLVESAIVSGDAAIKNWNLMGAQAMPNYSKLGGGEVIKHRVKKLGCPGCPVGCFGIATVKNGQYTVNEGHQPEYETLIAFGPMCLNDDLESVIKANDICNRYGMDTISTGTAIAFAMECYENGIIGKDETGGIDLTWGNAPAIISILEKIVRREGFGAVLADGVAKAAERIGRGAEKYAMHVHGQEPGFHEARISFGRGLAYVADPTPGRHTQGMLSMYVDKGISVAPYLELQVSAGLDQQSKGLLYTRSHCYWQVANSSGLCLFALISHTYPLIEFISAVTGWDFNIAEALITGRRIQTLRQAFNSREGLRPIHFCLPERLTRAHSAGPLAGISVDQEALRTSYYETMGWDLETGEPSKSAVQELELGDLIGLP